MPTINVNALRAKKRSKRTTAVGMPAARTVDVCECTKASAAQRSPGLGRVTHAFPYRDAEHSRVVFTRFRFEPPEGGKTYRYCPCYRSKDPAHAALLYGAHRVAEKVASAVPRVHLTEGEKDAETIWKHLHECATTGHQGVNFTVEMAEPFRTYEGEVWVHVDRDHLDAKHSESGRDTPGAVAALRKLRALRAVGIAQKRIRLVESAAGKDVEDHFGAGKKVEDFKAVPLSTIKKRAPKEAKNEALRTLGQLDASELPDGAALQRVIEALHKAKFVVEFLGRGVYKTQCPNPDHPDTNPSFEFKQGETGAIGFCHSRQCDVEDWLQGLGLKKSDLYDDLEDAADDVLAAVEGLFLSGEDVALDYLQDGLSDGQVLALDPPEFVIDGWMPQGFYSVVYGEPGAKKTFALLDMAKSIRRGIDWQGHSVQQGSVLFFQGEGLQQLTPRIAAWDAYHDDSSAQDAPGLYFGRNIDLTLPRGAAGVVRTVLRYQQEQQCRVVAVVIDPLVEFMTGEENGEGMELATRGLRAVAQYLDVAVIVGHHTNASGARARGGDWLRMRAGAHIRAESLPTGQTGLVQQKQKNAEKLALVLDPLLVGDSLVLTRAAGMTSVEYAAEKDSTESTERAQTKIKLSTASSRAKDQLGRELILDYVAAHPGANQGRVVGGCRGKGVGSDPLKRILDELAGEGGPLRVEAAGSATNSPRRFWLREGGENS